LNELSNLPLAFILILGSAVVLTNSDISLLQVFKNPSETFSVGFGPRLFGKKWARRITSFGLFRWWLRELGGDESNAPIEGAGAADIPPHEMFNLRPRWQRILVALAGPVMNIIPRSRFLLQADSSWSAYDTRSLFIRDAWVLPR